MEENKEMEVMEEKVETGMSVVQDFTGLSKQTNTKANIFTNITDKKKILGCKAQLFCVYHW